jgi:hypothetical protein
MTLNLFIDHRSLAADARLHLLLEAGATQERTL